MNVWLEYYTEARDNLTKGGATDAMLALPTPMSCLDACLQMYEGGNTLHVSMVLVNGCLQRMWDLLCKKYAKEIGDMEESLKGLELLFIRKNHDYGDAFARWGLVGILIMISNKLLRLDNLSRVDNKVEETTQDTVLDCLNYVIMAKAMTIRSSY